MSKTWYPVIDYTKCETCGVCTDKCKHGVYDLKKAPTPVVVQPFNCVHGCHGCGNLCPVGAIEYVGDQQKQQNDNCSCGSSNDKVGCQTNSNNGCNSSGKEEGCC